MKKNNGLAVVLILIGVMVLLGNTGFLGGELAIFIISLGLFAGYFLTGGPRRKATIGFLIPASILLMIGIYTYLSENFNTVGDSGGTFFLLLGSAFFLIYFIHNFNRKDVSFGEKNWPAITGLCLYVFGTLLVLIDNYDFTFAKVILQNLWPIGLILVGLLIIIRNFKKESKQ